jgi:oxygen-independent coproporphyrinogen-3 oxidase
LPDDDVVAAIETAGRHRLAAHGYERYEVSAYARGGCRSLHNVNYWEFGDYLGIGAGAHGKLTRFEPLRIERRARPRNPLSFMSRAGDPAAVTVETVGDPHGLALEFLLNALRLTGGVPLALFGERTGLEIVQIAEPLAAARDKGWLVADPERLSTTPVGLNQLNRVLELFA